jgi:hypothetical protein
VTALVSIGGGSIEQGQYSVATLNSGLGRAQSSVRACYIKTLTEKPDTRGTLNMRLQISPEGNTRGVGVRGSFLPTNLITCINRAFLAVSLPPPASGQSVNVAYQVALSSD